VKHHCFKCGRETEMQVLHNDGLLIAASCTVPSCYAATIFGATPEVQQWLGGTLRADFGSPVVRVVVSKQDEQDQPKGKRGQKGKPNR
jgi:hypothetical protein